MMETVQADRVFLVVVNRRHPRYSGKGADTDVAYLPDVYMSLERAQAEVELRAQRGDVGPIRWQRGSGGAVVAYDDESRAWMNQIVPLRLVQDDKPATGTRHSTSRSRRRTAPWGSESISSQWGWMPPPRQ